MFLTRMITETGKIVDLSDFLKKDAAVMTMHTSVLTQYMLFTNLWSGLIDLMEVYDW